MQTRHLLGILLLATTMACGGGNSNPNDPSSGGSSGGGTLPNGSMKATIDGAAWAAGGFGLSVTYLPPGGGLPALIGIGGADAVPRTVSFATYASGPGTYTTATGLGTNFNVYVGTAAYTAISTTAGTSGTVTFTTFTANHAVGTFSFRAAATGTGATGFKDVTNGTFDATY